MEFSNLFEIILLAGVHLQHYRGSVMSHWCLRNSASKQSASMRKTSVTFLHIYFLVTKQSNYFKSYCMQNSQTCLLIKIRCRIDIPGCCWGREPFKKLLAELLAEDLTHSGVQINTKENIFERYYCSVQTGMYFLFYILRIVLVILNLFLERIEVTQLSYLTFYWQLRILLSLRIASYYSDTWLN